MTLTEHPAVFGQEPTAAPLTMLDGLLSDLDEHPALTDTVDLPVTARPGWEIRCSTDIPYENLSAWRKGAQDPSMAVGTNELQLACSILVFACQGILVDGEAVLDEDGKAVTFFSLRLQEKLGVSRPDDAVRRLFRRDGFVTSAATALTREAGYGSEATPTRR